MLHAACPRCDHPSVEVGGGWTCPTHGSVDPLWRPAEASYDAFAGHLQHAGRFPTYLPWPMSPGWMITDFGVVVGPDGAIATVTCCSGTSALDGPVDVFVVAEETAVGLGARCAGVTHDDPGPEVVAEQPAVRVRIGSQSVPLWAISTSSASLDLDRSAFAGEAHGRWLWVVLRPASAMLLLRDEWILRDVSGVGPPLVEMPFGGPRPSW